MTGSDTLSGDPKMGLLNQVSWRGVSRFTPLIIPRSPYRQAGVHGLFD